MLSRIDAINVLYPYQRVNEREHRCFTTGVVVVSFVLGISCVSVSDVIFRRRSVSIAGIGFLLSLPLVTLY
jgi:hypothetical protein